MGQAVRNHRPDQSRALESRNIAFNLAPENSRLKAKSQLHPEQNFVPDKNEVMLTCSDKAHLNAPFNFCSHRGICNV